MYNLISSFRCAINGIQTVWREERNFRVETLLAVAVLCGATVLDFALRDWIIIVACVGAVLGAETVNTAIELLCDKVEPKSDPLIGKVKDMMGGFVFLVAVAAGIIGVLVFSMYL